jgi:hypothetical protein
MNPLGANYKRANPDLSNEDLLFDAAGVPCQEPERSALVDGGGC